MITQKIDLNLIHGQVRPHVNVSQYDSGSRTLEMAIYNGNERFLLAGAYTASIQGTKPDGHGFQYSATIDTVNNVITADVTQQMTAVFGDVICEVEIFDGDANNIGTGNFVLAVEKAALSDDTVVSDTQIPAIEQAAAIAPLIPTMVQDISDLDTAVDNLNEALSDLGLTVVNGKLCAFYNT